MSEARVIASAADLYQVLCDSQLFDSVEQTASGQVLVCYDAAGHAVMRTTGYQDIAFYADADHAVSDTSLGLISRAYLCGSGVILTKYYTGTVRRIFVLTKTNTGAPSLVHVNVDNSSWIAVTWGDQPTLEYKTMTAVRADQYALMPYVTNAALGINSYTPDAFYAVLHTGNDLPRSFTMHGERWFAVGKAVLRDNPQT